jgi:hypothetical protein
MRQVASTGLDIMHAFAEFLLPGLDCSKAPPERLTALVKSGNFGLKSGKGIYDWSERDGKPLLAARAQRLFQLVGSRAGAVACQVLLRRGKMVIEGGSSSSRPGLSISSVSASLNSSFDRKRATNTCAVATKTLELKIGRRLGEGVQT